MGNYAPKIDFGRRTGFGPAAARLAREPRLQREVEHVHRLGPRAMGCFVADLIDELGGDPTVLDRLAAWQRLDPQTVRALGGHSFPPAPLDLVPTHKATPP